MLFNMAMSYRLSGKIFLFLALMLIYVPTHAELDIFITKGRLEPLPVALAPFGSTQNLSSLGNKVLSVISNDLQNTGLFKALDDKSFLEKISSANQVPNFQNWRPLKAQALLTGGIQSLGNGRIEIKIRIWDVQAGKQIVGKRYAVQMDGWRRVSHIIANVIYERLTGEKGYFDTQITFVDETGSKKNRRKRLALMDQDGANVRYLTKGNEIVLSPRFSSDGKNIAYIAFGENGPRVFMHRIAAHQRMVLGQFEGMTFAPYFSPDSRKLVFSYAADGNTNIYIYNLFTRQQQRLTRGSAIDTSPSFSPDGQKIVFESDRGGRQQLYIMSVRGGTARRISYGGGRYSTPVWSPRGDLIAFTKQHEGRFSIGVIKTDGSGERILTSGYHNEGPVWSPNGRVLLFFRDAPGANSGSELWSVDITGYNERQIPTPSYASDPSWSPVPIQ